MDRFTLKIERFFKAVLPSPFTIAILLTMFVFLMVGLKHQTEHGSLLDSIGNMWYKGLWSSNGLVFLVQMMLMLVLGHILALSSPVNKLIHKLLKVCKTNAQAVFITALLAMSMSWINWGLGLIIGAIMARKTAAFLSQQGKYFNYPLIAAAGYTGLMIWHGGISGSSLIKVAETGHLQALLQGVIPPTQLISIPERIGIESTVFSPQNIVLCLLVIAAVSSSFYLLGKKEKKNAYQKHVFSEVATQPSQEKPQGAERLDHSVWLARLTALIILTILFLQIDFAKGMQFINPNFINAFLLGTCLIAHRSFSQFLTALNQAISGSSGILIQFPLYFGIMGLMRESGLVTDMAHLFIRISTETTLPIWTFFSAGLVNFFVPSGGGQWLIQGPIILKSCMEMGVPIEKGILALAYGDQITNMLQPFWALPLLGITGVKARDMIPYTFIAFCIGSLIFLVGLLF